MRDKEGQEDQDHEETRVNKSPSPSLTLTMRERFQCEECHYKTTAKDVLEKHMKLNHRKK